MRFQFKMPNQLAKPDKRRQNVYSDRPPEFNSGLRILILIAYVEMLNQVQHDITAEKLTQVMSGTSEA